MVVRVGGYFGDPLKGQHGMTQGDPLLPTMFNVVVDVVLRHWVSVVTEAEGEAIPEGFVWYIQCLAAFSMWITEFLRIYGQKYFKRRLES